MDKRKGLFLVFNNQTLYAYCRLCSWGRLWRWMSQPRLWHTW